MLQHEEVLLLYDEKKSQKRDKTSPACGGVFRQVTPQRRNSTMQSSVNLCVSSSPALKSKAMKEFTYPISISAVFSKSVKEMNKSPKSR